MKILVSQPMTELSCTTSLWRSSMLESYGATCGRKGLELIEVSPKPLAVVSQCYTMERVDTL